LDWHIDSSSSKPKRGIISRACGSDRELRNQVEALLENDSCLGDFLAKPIRDVLADMLEPAAQPDLTGRRVENYQVLSRLGRFGWRET
jgi:hypothetical protein